MNQSNRFEVLFFLPRLGGGGAEMNAVRLASGLLEAGIKPVYAVARGPGSYAEFLPDEVEVVVFDTGRINSSTLRLIRSMKLLSKLIDLRKPNVLCPVMISPALVALSAARMATHKPLKVLSIQNSLSVSHEKNADLRNRFELTLLRKNFPSFDSVISLSSGVANDLIRIVPQLKNKIEVIPNVGLPLPNQVASALSIPKKSIVPCNKILACGRLTQQKDYPTLLRAFSLLRGNDLRLQILGSGDLLKSLKSLVIELGLSDKVDFLGFQSDPFSYMREADIFVLSSRWEGFGNVLVEAMSMGTAVVSTDCPHGPGEIISDGDTGLLVPVGQYKVLATALQRLIDDPTLRNKLAKAGQVCAQDYSAKTIGAKYAAHFRALTTTKK